ncbi:MAG: hypothetical protein OEY14_12365, partial [Myxococcales bacterium]|nr:hypothetical protein [Myxococcales bacterium]
MSAEARSSTRGASAPGKLMLIGEYAVLEGAPCLVAAVGARAIARVRAQGEAANRARPMPEVEAARARAEAVWGPIPHALDVQVEALRRAGRKLGLGSSAAAAAAAA